MGKELITAEALGWVTSPGRRVAVPSASGFRVSGANADPREKLIAVRSIGSSMEGAGPCSQGRNEALGSTARLYFCRGNG